MIFFAVLFMIILATSPAHASTTTSTTKKNGEYVLRNTDGTIPVGFTATTNRFATDVLCYAAAEKAVGAGKLKPGTYKCDQSNAVTVTLTATCSDEPAPRIYLSLIDLPDGGGAKGYDLPEMEPPKLKAGSDSEYMPERDWLYVHNPAWPAGYPNCWVRGWEDPTKWRPNAVKDPGKVFLELVTPQNQAEVTELPNEESPVEWPADLKGRYAASKVERCAAHVSYPEDPCA
jgi:hypothetical protein